MCKHLGAGGTGLTNGVHRAKRVVQGSWQKDVFVMVYLHNGESDTFWNHGDVVKLRKYLDGWVITWLDKNASALFICCPVWY